MMPLFLHLHNQCFPIFLLHFAHFVSRKALRSIHSKLKCLFLISNLSRIWLICLFWMIHISLKLSDLLNILAFGLINVLRTSIWYSRCTKGLLSVWIGSFHLYNNRNGLIHICAWFCQQYIFVVYYNLDHLCGLLSMCRVHCFRKLLL
jgi:hypothetical protein